ELGASFGVDSVAHRDDGIKIEPFNGSGNGAVRQSFAGQDLYPSIEEKAAHLLYFTIKDHPFTDGNKRIGSFLFLLFLRLNQSRVNFDDKALVALTLLIAASAPEQKDLLIRLVVNLLSNE
ncbi:MAG: Fic family protein, partial [Candidatus Electrothrix sp. AR3]|nr:Fic family protein [Candidatus Electrothrix sp. AR3]